ncbi:MAG: GNAT family N-acetyltransferase [Clostridium sp.]
MDKVIYREFKERDLEYIKNLFIDTWKIDKYITSKDIQDKVAAIYVNMCIDESTFSKVAVINNRVVGIILGNREGNKRIASRIKCRYKILVDIISIALTGGDDKNKFKEYGKISRAYKELINGREKDFNGSVVFLVLDKDCQGLGIGKQLMKYLKEYMEEKDAKSIYVYTDTKCNYKFYDSQGFDLVDNRILNMSMEENTNELDIYLYKYDF